MREKSFPVQKCPILLSIPMPPRQRRKHDRFVGHKSSQLVISTSEWFGVCTKSTQLEKVCHYELNERLSANYEVSWQISFKNITDNEAIPLLQRSEVIRDCRRLCI